jgi:hypothetical protein
MKLKTLSALRRHEPQEIVPAPLPTEILIARLAREKALAINELICPCGWATVLTRLPRLAPGVPG